MHPRHLACLVPLALAAGCGRVGFDSAREAEWNYAAAGGSEQRIYPWSTPPSSTTIDSAHAVYASTEVAPVGSKSPSGDARWGHADLAGNVAEWLLDWYASTYPVPCVDCANLTPGIDCVFRGAGYFNDPAGLVTSRRNFDLPTTRGAYLGVRCARDP